MATKSGGGTGSEGLKGKGKKPKGARGSGSSTSGGTAGSGGGLTLRASDTIGSFLTHPLLPKLTPSGPFVVEHTDPLGGVVRRMHEKRLRSCVVSFPKGKREFFDYMDLNCMLLDLLGSGKGA